MNVVKSPISPCLISQLHLLYQISIQNLSTGKISKKGINGYSDSAIAVYPLALIVWESFIYETMISNVFSDFKNEIKNIPREIIDKWDILNKSIIIPKLIYGKTFDKDKSPFQDFRALVTLRNSIVHYKFDKPNDKTLKMVHDLYQKKIFLHSPYLKQDNGNITIYNWTKSVSSIEGIRWAINTIVKMAKQLNEFVPEEKREFVMEPAIHNFKEITEHDAKRTFIKFNAFSG